MWLFPRGWGSNAGPWLRYTRTQPLVLQPSPLASVCWWNSYPHSVWQCADHLSIGLFRHPEPWDSSSTMVETHTWKCRQGPLPCWEGVELVVRNQVPHLRVGYTGSSVVTGPHWGVRQPNKCLSSRVPFYASIRNTLFHRMYS